MSKRLDIFISVCVAVVLGTSGFYAGIYYGFQKSEEYVENILDDFKQISSDVAAFKKISDPKTIRSYVTELNKILDDITLLDRLITTGQISSESLDGIFIEHNDKLDDIKNRILCTATMLNNIYLRNKTSKKGILRNYTIKCIGEQETFEDILLEKLTKITSIPQSNI